MPKYALHLLAAMFVMATTLVSAKQQIFLGPANSGAAGRGADWFTGANGAGYTTVDFDDAAKAGFDFTISNTVAGKANNADWRCPPFSLGPAAAGARPVTFSFAYKLAGPVAKGNNVHVQLRFFDSTGTNFISEIVLPVGAHTRDSRMSAYKTLTFENLPVPRKARTADVWIDANIFEPWVSGTARFADISVATMPRSLLFKAGVMASVLAGICVLILPSIYLWRRRVPG